MKRSQTREIAHSQNFLKNPGFVASLVKKADIDRGDLVVEIGPGRGVITKQLAKYAGRVIAVEVDANLAESLIKKFGSCPNVQIVKADFLKWHLPAKPYKVFSNIPFNITADIVGRLCGSENPPVAAYLIMQDKAAERFAGSPLAENTQISILLKPWFEVEVIAKVSKQQFAPTPRVNAVLLKFTRRTDPLVKQELTQQFRDFVVYGYNQWKPTVLDAFEKVFSRKQRRIIEKQSGIKDAKPSDLTLKQWLLLFDTFVKCVPYSKQALIEGGEQKLKAQQKRLQKQHRTRS